MVTFGISVRGDSRKYETATPADYLENMQHAHKVRKPDRSGEVGIPRVNGYLCRVFAATTPYADPCCPPKSGPPSRDLALGYP